MQFRIHESGLHYFYSRDQELTFVNTISYNKEGFTAVHIKGAEAARDIYATLIYPSAKGYKGVICSNQFKNCPVTVQDVKVVQKLHGNNIAALEGKTT